MFLKDLDKPTKVFYNEIEFWKQTADRFHGTVRALGEALLYDDL